MSASSGAGATPRLALVMIVRDEERFLEAHLRYHGALGVTRAFVYLDRCTDRSAEIVARFPWADAIRRDRDPVDRFLSEHQVRVLGDAIGRAREAGFDWLLHIDADEFARGASDDASSAVGSLLRLLEEVSPETEQVILPPVDVLPTALAPGEPFHRLHWILQRGKLRRRILDPSSGAMRMLDKRIGHTRGKAIVRTAVEVKPLDAHRWGRAADGEELVSERRGRLYHFVVVDGEGWWSKHRRLAEYPGVWSKGKAVAFPKQAWKEAAVRMTLEEATAYFDRWVRVAPWRLWLPRLLGRVARDDFVERVLAAIEAAGDGVE